MSKKITDFKHLMISEKAHKVFKEKAAQDGRTIYNYMDLVAKNLEDKGLNNEKTTNSNI